MNVYDVFIYETVVSNAVIKRVYYLNNSIQYNISPTYDPIVRNIRTYINYLT